MNFETTSILLKAIQPYLENSIVKIKSKSKNWHNRRFLFDHVTIDAKNKLGFGVFENEIIVFYFTSHCHFKNQFSKLQDGERDYMSTQKYF